jgi:hypothetical protein
MATWTGCISPLLVLAKHNVLRGANVLALRTVGRHVAGVINDALAFSPCLCALEQRTRIRWPGVRDGDIEPVLPLRCGLVAQSERAIFMAGIIVPICEKRVFEYSYLASTTTQDIVLHPGVDVGAWYRVRGIVLVHQISVTSGNFKLKLQHAFPCEQDRQEFVDTTDFLTSASITNASPNIKTISGTDPQGYLKVILRADQTTTTGAILYGEFSVYLVLRDV